LKESPEQHRELLFAATVLQEHGRMQQAALPILMSTGAHFVNAIQPDAADQSLVAALNMAGQCTSWQGAFRMNVLATFGLVSSSPHA
jgi:hypothetical protein